jgi:acetolactate synthase I/II/III large subunit
MVYMRVADYITEFLFNNGIKTSFMLSGTGSVFLDDAFANYEGMSYVSARHESAAVMMAVGYYKSSQKPGVALVTTGPGGANAVGGVVEAWVDSVPVIIISGQVESKFLNKELRYFGAQGLNILPIIEPITKFSKTITDPYSIQYYLEKALYCSLEGRPGPVWLDIPFDIQSAIISDPSKMRMFKPPQRIEASIDEATSQVDLILEKIINAKRPLFILGQGVRQGDAIEEFKKTIELFDVPFLVSRVAIDIFKASYKNNLGLAGMKGSRYSQKIMDESDLVLSLGCSMNVAFTNESEALFPNADVIMINNDQNEFNKPGLNLDMKVLLDVKLVLEEMIKKILIKKNKQFTSWTEYCLKLKKDYPIVSSNLAGNPINSYFLVSRLAALSNIKQHFVSDAGSSYYVTGQALDYEFGQKDITSGAFATMGVAIPMAIGASCYDKDAQIIVVTGDGSLELNIQELKTVSQNSLNIKIFVINNGGYASIRESQDEYSEGRYTEDEDILDFSKIANAFEMNYEIIDDYISIDEQINKITSNSNPTLIEVVCERDQKIFGPEVI